MTATNIDAFNSLSLELKTEFFTSFKEAMEELDQCFSVLDNKYDEEIINQMFREVHSVKGNAHMVFLDPIAEVCHKLEDLVHQIRKGEYLYTPAQGEFMTFVFARLEQLIAEAISDGAIPEIHTTILTKAITRVYEASMAKRDAVIQKTLDSLSGILTNSTDQSNQVLGKLEQQESEHAEELAQEALNCFDEIEFMADISQRINEKSIQQPGDNKKLLNLCIWLNQLMDKPADDSQLTAAFYFQALGARFVSSPVFDIELESASWERDKAIEQLELSAGFLRLSSKWSEAVEIIQQSYERYDGGGPLGLKANQINRGSMAIALIRYYQQCYHKLKKDNKAKIAVSKSLSRINSEKGYRFSSDIVESFNQLVRTDLLGVML